jgi:hypothetical protein
VTRQDFIRAHRTEIDRQIHAIVPNIGSLTDGDRETWINSDAQLYEWMRAEVGQRIVRPRDQVYA